jgi:hypothetical protein
VDYTFTRPDGTQLGTQGSYYDWCNGSFIEVNRATLIAHCAWLQDCESWLLSAIFADSLN